MGTDQIWQNRAVAENFLTGVQGAVPVATEQIDIALGVLDQLERPIQRVADLGCGDGAIAEMRQILASLTSTPELAAS